MDFEKLTPEQQAKARSCKTVDELVDLAKEDGVELTDAELDAISGGKWGLEGGECGTPFLGSDR